MKDKEIKMVVIAIIILIIAIIFIIKANSKVVYKEIKDYKYITVEGETFETKDIIKISCDGIYDRCYTITLNDGTIIYTEGYILRNEIK